MGSNSVVWFTALFIPLIATCHCATVVKHYHLAYPNSRMSQWSTAYQNMHLTRCIARCSENVTCYSISYDVIHGDCRLSHWSVPFANKIVADGWHLYKLDPPGPDIGDYFTVGNYSIAMSSQRVTKAEAESLCASSGFGRLVEIRSIQMYLVISDYLMNMSQDLNDLYGNIWMAGEYSSGAYRVPDGSILPITPANDYDADGSRPCLALKNVRSFMYDDILCLRSHSYMCERV